MKINIDSLFKLCVALECEEEDESMSYFRLEHYLCFCASVSFFNTDMRGKTCYSSKVKKVT